MIGKQALARDGRLNFGAVSLAYCAGTARRASGRWAMRCGTQSQRSVGGAINYPSEDNLADICPISLMIGEHSLSFVFLRRLLHAISVNIDSSFFPQSYATLMADFRNA